jgi:phosphonate transport system substrate-binding protein
MNNTKLQYCGLFTVYLVFVCLIAGCAKNGAPIASDQLRIGVVPWESASAIQAQYGPFGDYVGSKLHKHASIIVTQDYIGIIQALQSDQIEVAYLNPLSYVLFADKMQNTPEHLIPLSMPWVHGTLFYNGVIFTTKDSGIDSVADLKGKRMAFVDPVSTSGYLYPYQYLMQHGVNPDKDLAGKYFAGDEGVVPAVLNKSVDAGAIFQEGLTLSTKNSPGDFAKLKVLAVVGPIANGMLVARGNMDPAEIAQLKQVLIDVNTDPAAQSAMKTLQVTKWQPADDKVFDPVRQAAATLGMNIQALKSK